MTPSDSSSASQGGIVRVGVAVPAAGSGERMGGERKPWLTLEGAPVLERALRPFLAEPRVVAIRVALAPDDARDPPNWLTELDDRIHIVAGGATRSASVSLALAALPDELEVIAVHDAARPLVTPEVISSCIDIAAQGHGAVAGSPAVDTIKRVDGSSVIVETPDRARLWHAHTPQVFPASVLREAYADTETDGMTDDSSLVERLGAAVRMVDDGGANLKVTRPADVDVAEAIIRARQSSPERGTS